jgi:LYR motif-containing protein 4
MNSRQMTRQSVVSLYRNIVRSAKVFPSRNRGRILTEIRFDFRKNKDLEAGEKLSEALGIAVKGLSQLNMYTNLDPTRGADWAVTLDSSPMPDNK